MAELSKKKRDGWHFFGVALLFALGCEYFIQIVVMDMMDVGLALVLPIIYGLYVSAQWAVLSLADRPAMWWSKHPTSPRLLPTLVYWIGFTLFGFFVIEWIWMKHSGEMWLVQISMLSFWSGVALLPALFTDPDLPGMFKHRAKRQVLILMVALVVPAVGLELVGFDGERNTALYLAFMGFTIGLQWTLLRYVRWLACAS